MKIRRIIFLLIISTIFSASVRAQVKGVGVEPVSKLPAKEKRWALIIGVSKYNDGNITMLPGANNDAKSLRDALRDHAGFDEKQIITLTTDETPDRQPTRGNILKQLGNFKGLIPKDGLLFVAFSGHGIERQNQAFLLASDTPYNDNPKVLERTALSVSDDFRELIRDTGVGQVIILLDACRNDPSSGRSSTDNPLTEPYKEAFNFDGRNNDIEAFATLYATSVGERAYEYTRENKGYFTWAFIEGLKGGAATGTGEVTLGGLIRFVEKYVPQQVKLDLGSSKLQRPFSIIEGFRADDLVLAIAKNKPVDQNADAISREAKFWQKIENSTNAAEFEDYLERTKRGEFTGIYKVVVELKLSQLKKRVEPTKTPAEPVKKTDDTNSTSSTAEVLASLDDFVFVNGGTFLMGAQRTERSVSGFKISKKKITQAQWIAVVGSIPSYFSGCGECPVENVSWNEIQTFLTLLISKRPGWTYRLPSEAEWELAARAGSTTDSIPDLNNSAWHNGNSLGKTHPVGEKAANKWGLFDMLGNVMEWTTDEYDTGGESGLKIVRGCSFTDSPGKCTVVRRDGLPPDSKRSTLGFRLVRFQGYPVALPKKKSN